MIRKISTIEDPKVFREIFKQLSIEGVDSRLSRDSRYLLFVPLKLNTSIFQIHIDDVFKFLMLV